MALGLWIGHAVEAAEADVAVAVVGLLRGGDDDPALGGGVDEEEGAVRVDLGDDAHMSHGAPVTAAAVEDKVAHRRRVVGDASPLSPLATGRRGEVEAVVAVDKPHETGAVEALGGLARPAVGGADVARGEGDDRVGVDGLGVENFLASSLTKFFTLVSCNSAESSIVITLSSSGIKFDRAFKNVVFPLPVPPLTKIFNLDFTAFSKKIAASFVIEFISINFSRLKGLS